MNVTASSVVGGSLLAYINDLQDVSEATHNLSIPLCPDSVNPITIDLTGDTGTILQWEKYEAGDNSWTVLNMTADTYDIVFDYSSSKSVLYRVLLSSGTCYEYSTIRMRSSSYQK